MDKVKIALTVLTIAIMVGPLAVMVYIYRDNLLGLVLPPQVSNLVNMNNNTNSTALASNFHPPMPVGQPKYNPENRTYTFAFNFTNPLESNISVDSMSAGVICKQHNVFLGNVSLDSPLRIAPNETAIIDISGGWTEEALNHFKTYHSGPEDDDINVGLENLNVEVAGIQVSLDKLPDIGWVPLPPR